jgi:hypothetical protein
LKQTEYLDAAKQKLGIESDYALAPYLQMTRAAVSKLRNRRLVMSNTTAGKIAKITRIPLAKIIIDLELERGSNDTFWKSFRDAAVVAVLALCSLLMLPGMVQPSYAGPGHSVRDGHYVKFCWGFLKRLFRGLL